MYPEDVWLTVPWTTWDVFLVTTAVIVTAVIVALILVTGSRQQ